MLSQYHVAAWQPFSGLLYLLRQAIEAMVKLRFHPGKDVLARVAARAGLRSGRSLRAA